MGEIILIHENGWSCTNSASYSFTVVGQRQDGALIQEKRLKCIQLFNVVGVINEGDKLEYSFRDDNEKIISGVGKVTSKTNNIVYISTIEQKDIDVKQLIKTRYGN